MIQECRPASAPQDAIAVVNVGVFDGEHDTLFDGPVLIRGTRIVSVGEPVPGAVRSIDGHGGVVVPGLIDAHFHAYACGTDARELERGMLSYLAIGASVRLANALRRGFTTVRDLAGGDPGLVAAITRGWVQAPRYLYSGAALSQSGGHGDLREPCDPGASYARYLSEVVDGADNVARAVRIRLRQGAHAIKLFLSGGVLSANDPLDHPQYGPEEIDTAVSEASRRGSYVAAHAYTPEAVSRAVQRGVRSIEHGNLIDANTAQLMATRGAFLVPTLATYDSMSRHGQTLGLTAESTTKNMRVYEAGIRAIELASAAGVSIGFGTDLIGVMETDQLRGVALQIEAMGVSSALRSITSVNADLIGRPDLGRVRPEATADLVILRGNPLDRPSVLTSPRARRTVIQAGRVVTM